MKAVTPVLVPAFLTPVFISMSQENDQTPLKSHPSYNTNANLIPYSENRHRVQSGKLSLQKWSLLPGKSKQPQKILTK